MSGGHKESDRRCCRLLGRSGGTSLLVAALVTPIIGGAGIDTGLGNGGSDDEEEDTEFLLCPESLQNEL